MTRYFTLIFLFISCSLMAQYDAEEVTFLGTYDDDTLPTHTYGTFNDVWGYAADDKEYAIVGSTKYIHIFDVTDPTNLVEITKIAPGNETVWRDFKTFGHYLYGVADSAPDGLVVIDLSVLPNVPSIVSQNTSQFNSCHNIYIDEANARLYSAGAGQGTNVYDLSINPQEPDFIGKATLGGNRLHDLYVRDNIAYCSAGNPGFFIYDLTDVANEKLLASAETNGYNHSSWLSDDGSFAFFAEEVPRGLPLGIMDLCDMENGNIEVNNYFKFPLIEGLAPADDLVTPHNPFVKGDFVYVSYYRDGLHVYNISDPENVTRVGYFDAHPQNTDYAGTYQGTWGCYPYLPSGNILLSDMDNGLFVVDFLLDNDEPGTGTLCAPSSSDDIKAEGFSIAPNPTSGFIKIELPESVQDYNLTAYSITGQQVWSESGAELQNGNIDLTFLQRGIYILEISTEGRLFREKVVLK